MRGSLVEWEGEDRAGPAGRVPYQLEFGRLCFVVHRNWEQDYPSRIVYRKPAGREIIPYIRMTLPELDGPGRLVPVETGLPVKVGQQTSLVTRERLGVKSPIAVLARLEAQEGMTLCGPFKKQ